MNPQWRRDGREIFYHAGGKLLAVKVKSNATELDFEPATPLFNHASDAWKIYSVNADGQRFLITQIERRTAEPFTFILNWTALLKK